MPEECNNAGNPNTQVISNGGTKAMAIDDEPADDGSATRNEQGSPGGESFSSPEARSNEPQGGGCSSVVSHVVEIPFDVVPDGATTAASASPRNQPGLNSETINDGEDCPCPIRKVHGRVRDIDPDAYDPMVVSLGPYHAGRGDLRPMNSEKKLCLKYLCELTGRMDLDYLQVINRVSQDAEKYYLDGVHDRGRGRSGDVAGVVEHSQFLFMLLQDAAFLLVAIGALDKLMKKAGHKGEKRSHDRWKDVAIFHDMLLLENQVPFVVVEKLYQAATDGHHGCNPSLSSVMEKFIRINMIDDDTNNDNLKREAQDSPQPDVHHLLHMCHTLLKPTVKTAVRDNAGVKRRWHRAVQYRVAGVGLKKRLFDGCVNHQRLLDVEYRRGALEIPVIHVYDNTCSMFRNLMAMEQASVGVGHYVTAYCIFLSRLMCTAEDVALLTKKGILVHHLGSDEVVAGLFADLCKHIVFNDDDDESNYLRTECKAADERYQSRVRNWMTLLKHNYFSNPWLAMGAAAAVLVTFCTLVQTVFTVFPRN